MAGPLIYLDTSDVRPGALDELRDAIEELTEFVESNEPHLLGYQVYFSDDGSQMTVIHRHVDSASLEYHMDRRPCVRPVRGLGHAVVDLSLWRAERERVEAAQ